MEMKQPGIRMHSKGGVCFGGLKSKLKLTKNSNKRILNQTANTLQLSSLGHIK